MNIPDAAIEAAAEAWAEWNDQPGRQYRDDGSQRDAFIAGWLIAESELRETIAQLIDTFRESNAGRAVETRRDAYVNAAAIVRGGTP